MVLQKLRDVGLYAKLERCIFYQSQVEFLECIISGEGLSMDRKKIQTIMEWRTPKTIRDVQCFLSFINFYQLFIQDYLKIAAPLMCLTCKNKLEWNVGAYQAFQDLKVAFTMVLILIHPDFLKPFFLESDISDYILRTVLSQNKEDRQLYPIAFHSRKFTTIEINYEIHNKELLTTVNSLQEWR